MAAKIIAIRMDESIVDYYRQEAIKGNTQMSTLMRDTLAKRMPNAPANTIGDPVKRVVKVKAKPVAKVAEPAQV